MIPILKYIASEINTHGFRSFLKFWREQGGHLSLMHSSVRVKKKWYQLGDALENLQDHD